MAASNIHEVRMLLVIQVLFVLYIPCAIYTCDRRGRHLRLLFLSCGPVTNPWNRAWGLPSSIQMFSLMSPVVKHKILREL